MCRECSFSKTGKNATLAVGAARGDDGDLALEVDERLEDARHATEGGPRRIRLREILRMNPRLALPVVPECGRLEDGGGADGGERRSEVLARAHRRPRRERDIHLSKKILLSLPVLRNPQRLGARAERDESRSIASRAARGTFSNSNVRTSRPLRECREPVEVVVRRRDLDVRDVAGRGVLLGRVRVDAVAHRARPTARTCGRAGRSRGRRPSSRAGRSSRETGTAGPSASASIGTRGASSGERGPRVREDRDREEARVDRAGLADRERADGNARGHLRDREERVEALRARGSRRARRGRARPSARRACRAGARRRRRPRR